MPFRCPSGRCLHRVRVTLPLTRLTLSRELLCFLVVGGLGYVVDVVAFNVLLSHAPFSGWDPTYARIVAMAAAMVVTFSGNRWWTWQDSPRQDRRREAVLFVVFNLVGLVISLGALVVTHDLLGLTSRLDDNISANVIGLGLATAFRFWSYRTFVFGGTASDDEAAQPERIAA
jgi:putative flippase GtrA